MWIMWGQTALLQMLERNNQPTNGTSSVSTLGNSEILLQGTTTRRNPETWYRPGEMTPMFITPASRQPIEDVLDHEVLFGGVTQTLALQDDMWGYDLMVSERNDKGGSTSMKSILTTTMPSVDPKQSDRTDIGNMCHGTYTRRQLKCNWAHDIL
jgi:hypothetical protein